MGVCVCVFVRLWVCYHDNSKLRVDPHQTGVVAKGSDHLLMIKFWPSCPPPREGGLRRGEIFWLCLTTASAQCLRFSFKLCAWRHNMPPRLRPLQVDNIFAFIRQMAPVPACWPFKHQQQVDLWSFDLESGVLQVTCDVGYLCVNFSLPRPLCSRRRPDVRDRHQTHRRQTKALLIASSLWGGDIITLPISRMLFMQCMLYVGQVPVCIYIYTHITQ